MSPGSKCLVDQNGCEPITDYCMECKCYEDSSTTTTNPVANSNENLGCDANALILNGVCNDEANTLGCNYEGCDCCGPDIDTHVCTECHCLGTSHKYNARIQKIHNLDRKQSCCCSWIGNRTK